MSSDAAAGVDILAISYDIPRPDRSSGELRFLTMLSLLARKHRIRFWGRDVSEKHTDHRLFQLASDHGIKVDTAPVKQAIRRNRIDVVLIEFYWMAPFVMDAVRAWRPDARVIIDSVDVHFHRLRGKARVSGNKNDRKDAEAVRRAEVAAYRQADTVLTVSDSDKRLLVSEGVSTPISVIPNIHVIPPLQPRGHSDRLELVFIGAYKWPPNVDGILYFCNEVLPLIRKKVPKLRLRIVGSDPTHEVIALAAVDVEVVGYVPDTAPILASSDISIAPLRYGGGIKGKVGEAMAHGLPVVSTSVGAEGFGFAIGSDVLVGDTPQAFADAVVRLWQEPDLYESVRRNGWAFIKNGYSVEAVEDTLERCVLEARKLRVKRMPVLQRLHYRAPELLDRYLLWRFRD